jgi:4a-hydroxytetrahydrobiopterin dehydratase
MTVLDPHQAALSINAAGWRAVANRPAIAKSFKFADFDGAFAFMTAVAATAKVMDHHPEWSNIYSKVEVVLTTHSAGGVTARDVELARAMEQAARGL